MATATVFIKCAKFCVATLATRPGIDGIEALARTYDFIAKSKVITAEMLIVKMLTMTDDNDRFVYTFDVVNGSHIKPGTFGRRDLVSVVRFDAYTPHPNFSDRARVTLWGNRERFAGIRATGSAEDAKSTLCASGALDGEEAYVIVSEDPASLVLRSKLSGKTKTYEKDARPAFRAGDRVVHEKYGSGRVISVDGNVAAVAFDRKKPMRLDIRIAPLTKVELMPAK